jgi:hypothetical protein
MEAAQGLVLTSLMNNNQSLSDKKVTGATCHAGFHGATHPISQTHDR